MNKFWRDFETTGSVENYLSYKASEEESTGTEDRTQEE